MYERAQLPGLLGQAPTYPSGLNGTFELAIDLPTSADVDREFDRIVKPPNPDHPRSVRGNPHYHGEYQAAGVSCVLRVALRNTQHETRMVQCRKR